MKQDELGTQEGATERKGLIPCGSIELGNLRERDGMAHAATIPPRCRQAMQGSPSRRFKRDDTATRALQTRARTVKPKKK